MLDREEFQRRLAAAAARAVEWARARVIETLPDAIRFSVILHEHDPISLLPQEHVYPDDEREPRSLLSEDVVSLLWRDGLVPRWIDLRVVAADSEFTIVQADVSGRFTDDDSLLHAQMDGLPPFLVKVVGCPPEIRPRSPFEEPSERYSLYWARNR